MNFKFEIPTETMNCWKNGIIALKSTMRNREGEPLLLIHGNGGSIESMGNQSILKLNTELS
jgi:hypothetical protein